MTGRPDETVTLRPTMPYSLSASLRGSAGGTRRRRDGAWEIALRIGDEVPVLQVRQRRDGALEIRVAQPVQPALERIRHVLALDLDHGPFIARFEDDPVIGRSVRARRGMRPARLATVGQAMIAGFAGQLVTSAEARATHRALVALLDDRCGAGPLRPPALDEVGALPAAAAAAAGLTARRAASLIRAARRIEPGRLSAMPTPRATAYLQRERDIGPWTAAVVLASGLGRGDIGPVGDLGLIRLCEQLLGRSATVDDTRELLARYEGWEALAGAHLLGLPAARRRRSRPPARRRY
jgi:AraC family transcriptional regulator of adaptative response / DNA-3-methyladenine glycosylase II